MDLGPQLPADCPVSVQRWLEVPEAAKGSASSGTSTGGPWRPGEVHVLFRISNPADAGKSVEIGALGLSMPMVRTKASWGMS